MARRFGNLSYLYQRLTVSLDVSAFFLIKYSCFLEDIGSSSTVDWVREESDELNH
jgi:hypothetical protein